MSKIPQEELQALAGDFLQQMRKSKLKQKQSQERQERKMELEMDSDSEAEAQDLFQNVIPISEEPSKRQEIHSQPIVQSENDSQDSEQRKNRSEKERVEKEKLYNVILSSHSDPSEKQRATKSILKNGALQTKEKQKQKTREQKSDKKISFSGLVLPLNTEIQKRWKDPIENEKKGKFDKEEERILSEAVGKFLTLNGISIDEFSRLLSSSEKSDVMTRKQKIFSLLATVLPNRSVMSCYKYLRRNFNSLNHKGKWTEEEVEELRVLVERYGRKWSMIGREMKRTADNVYDKYRQLGDENMNERIKGIWALKEVVHLLEEIEKMTKIKFLDKSIRKQLERQTFHDQKQKEDVLSRKYNSKNFIFHNIGVVKPYINARNFQKINISLVRWGDISQKLKTRTTLDCRNKTVQLLQIFFHTSAVGLDEQIVSFLWSKRYQSQSEIKWIQIKGVNGDQAKNRFMIMKKMVEGRSVKDFRQIIEQLKERAEKKIQNHTSND